MKLKTKVIEVRTDLFGESTKKVLGSFEIEGRNDDEIRAKARAKLAARRIRSISRGPRGLVIYILPVDPSR